MDDPALVVRVGAVYGGRCCRFLLVSVRRSQCSIYSSSSGHETGSPAGMGVKDSIDPCRFVGSIAQMLRMSLGIRRCQCQFLSVSVTVLKPFVILQVVAPSVQLLSPTLCWSRWLIGSRARYNSRRRHELSGDDMGTWGSLSGHAYAVVALALKVSRSVYSLRREIVSSCQSRKLEQEHSW